MKKHIGMLLLVLLTAAGCAHQAPSMQEKMVNAAPRSILVVPVVNKSVDVTAADYMLSTVSIPLAEKGYYVFPVNMVKRVLEDDGLADSSLVHSAPTSRLAQLFGADAVLYITIDRWDAQYMVLTTKVTVGVQYEIRCGKTDEVLWQHNEQMVYMPDGGGGGGVGGLIAKVVVAAVTKAAPNYMPLAQQANQKTFIPYPGPGIPPGPYALEAKQQ